MRDTSSAIATKCLLLCIVILCFRCVSQAQGDGQDGRIHLDVVVSDASGRPVTGLKAQEFKLYVDGEERQIATFASYDDFTAKPYPAAQMIIVIDSLNNGIVEMGYMRQGLEKFLRENEGRLGQPTTIAQLVPSGIQFLSQPSRDGNALADIVKGIDATVMPKGIDTLPVSLNALVTVAKTEVSEPGRKLLVWLGPGWATPMLPATPTEVDERNQRTYYAIAIQIAKLLHDARMVLYGGYSAGEFYMREFLKPVKKASDMDARGLRLNVLAIKSGGRGELPETNRDSVVAETLEHFAAEANSFYAISFNPPKVLGADEFHEVRVEVKWQVLKARTITGYYDEPDDVQGKSKKEAAVILQKPVNERSATEPASLRLLTVAQFADVVESAKSKPDGEAANEIEHLKLVERLSSPKLSALSSSLPGAKAKTAVMAVADASVFLAPAKEDIPDTTTPDLAEQRQIVSRTVDYLKNTVPKLPNFYAKRLTTSFEEVWTPKGENGTHKQGVLKPTGQFRATMYYRKGKEVARAEGAEEHGLMTRGTFGPILTTVILDAAHSSMRWGHWEEGSSGKIAVFQIRVPQAQSHYETSSWGSIAEGDVSLLAPSAYHAEIGIEPSSGAILRLVLEADPELGSSMERADIMVEYGPVVIGGKVYTCPVRSVSIATAQAGQLVNAVNAPQQNEERKVMRLDDFVFSDYHVFRSEMRIVP